ncbi:unnamed protein product [Phaedon cochleariae]|uniref:Tesmin/TSO1-like CXC domain-containing protein n=1 Tax=Phaedon cochleariae TaxID=80249 RepID=A0A9N9SKU2_PHACE|nr:unnamed protein product [Phaedon cochleariae]
MGRNKLVGNQILDKFGLYLFFRKSIFSEFNQKICKHSEIFAISPLFGLGRNLKNVFFLKPRRGRTPEHLYSPTSFKYEESVATHILLLHAISGCDTSSSLFNIGKAKFVNALQKAPKIGTSLELFKKQDVDEQVLAKAGERLLIAVYGGGEDVRSLNELRFKCFTKSVSKAKFNLATLPPTTEAAEQHIYRSYLQVQMWLGYELDATKWGWTRGARGLEPLTTTAAPAPEALLKTISCKCTKNCGGMCGCRKAGLKCSVLCHNCAGQTCDNVTQLRAVDDEDSDDNNDIDDPAPLTLNLSELFLIQVMIRENLKTRGLGIFF